MTSAVCGVGAQTVCTTGDSEMVIVGRRIAGPGRTRAGGGVGQLGPGEGGSREPSIRLTLV
jgi:hypothetical protein